MKRQNRRQQLLFTLLAASLVLTAWVAFNPPEETATVAPRPRRTPATETPAVGPAPGTPAGWPGAATAVRGDWPPLDPQARAAWGDAAPPIVAAPPTPEVEAPPEPPPPPSAPPFPYQLVGRLTDPQPRAVLNNAQRSAVVGVGEVVDGQWRVDAFEAGGLRLTYLPLGLAQFVPFASPA